MFLVKREIEMLQAKGNTGEKNYMKTQTLRFVLFFRVIPISSPLAQENMFCC